MTSFLPPFQPQPDPSTENLGAIEFLHPGYPPPYNVLLRIARVDRVAATEPLGVHHGTALVALQIIADNAFETGRFTLDKDGQEEVQTPLDAILTEDTYYFVIGDSPSQYPVVPSFQDWSFPHRRVPRAWTSAAVSSFPDLRCAITNSSIAIESAHLVPSEHDEWYSFNRMDQYGGDINNSGNIIRLAPHFHRYFDNRWVAFVPKASRIDEETGSESRPSSQYVLHLMNDSVHELFPTFQNTLIQHVRASSHPYLFARFAWTVLLSVKYFITRGPNRNVTRLYYTSETGKSEYKSEMLTGPELQMFYGGGGSKKATPKKRRTQTGSAADDDQDDEDWEDSATESNDIFMGGIAERGRKKLNLSSDETAVGERVPEHVAREIKERFVRGMPATSTEAEEEYIA